MAWQQNKDYDLSAECWPRVHISKERWINIQSVYGRRLVSVMISQFYWIFGRNCICKSITHIRKWNTRYKRTLKKKKLEKIRLGTPEIVIWGQRNPNSGPLSYSSLLSCLNDFNNGFPSDLCIWNLKIILSIFIYDWMNLVISIF